MGRVAQAVKDGEIAVIPTDTIYGVVASAFNPVAVEKLYLLRHRKPEKPFIVLIADVQELARFGVEISSELMHSLARVWPGPVSVIFSCPGETLSYLHRGSGSLAFRVPKPEWLRRFLEISGPLVAPSANFEGEPPSHTLKEARNYFSSSVEHYFDGGVMDGNPSTLVRYERGSFSILRHGAGDSLLG